MDQGSGAALADRMEAQLMSLGTPTRAAGQKRYLKSDLAFLGATMGQIRAVVKASGSEIGELDHDRLLALVEALWSKPVHERRMAATVLLGRNSTLLRAADLPMVERLLRDSRTWALVDGLAVDAVGAVLASDNGRTIPILDRWASDADFWIRRASLLAWLRPLRAGAPPAAFLGYADAMLDEKEFFIRKAIGWVLREVGKRRPDEVAGWLAPRTHRASGVTVREAVRYLPVEQAEPLTAAYRERRRA